MTARPEPARPDVSIVMPVFNKLDLTRACVASLHAQAGPCSFEILVVDNGSSDGTAAWLAETSAAGLVRAVPAGGNLGFSRGCNLGARHARGRYLLFLNNDMEVLPGWLEPLVATLDADPDVGIVGARLLFPDGTIQHAGVAMIDYVDEEPPLLGGQHKSYRKPHDDPEVLRPQVLQVVTGACLAIRPELFAAIGGFDEAYWNGNEDVDLCLKAGEAGWLVVYRPESTVIHYESQSGPERWARMEPNIARFNAVWRGRARPDFVNRGKTFVETPASAIRVYTPPGHLHADRRRGWPDAPEATVIVAPGGDAAARRRALAALALHTDARHHLHLLDGGSDPGLSDALAALAASRPRIVVTRGAGIAALNTALAAAAGDACAVLAGDALVTPGWLDALLAGLGHHPRAGLAGPVTNAPAVGQTAVAPATDDDHALAACAATLAAGGAEPRRATQLAGFCVLLRRTLVERVGGFDPACAETDGAVIDLCLRAGLGGWDSVVVPTAYVHLPPRTAAATAAADEAHLAAKWPLGPTRADELRDLLARGFLAPLHFETLPAHPHLTPVPASPWDRARWLDAGEAAFAAGRVAEAVRLFRAAAAADPADARAANDLAVALLRLDPDGRGPALARALLARILAIDPGNADAAWNLQALESANVG